MINILDSRIIYYAFYTFKNQLSQKTYPILKVAYHCSGKIIKAI